jgi:hypothetical protein
MLIFGDKTLALLDLWSLEHFFAGCNSAVMIGFLVKKYLPDCDEKNTFRFQFLFLLILELYWESLEYYLEDGASIDAVTYWFQGVEHISNRLISDPLVTVAGLFAIRRFPQLKWPAIIFSSVWLCFHLFVFDHCMAVQDMIFGK